MDLQKPPQFPAKKSDQLQYLFLGLGAGLGIICVIGIIVLSLFPDISPFKAEQATPNNKQAQVTVAPPSNNVLAKVGTEFIYKKDLAYELEAMPNSLPNEEQVLREKLIQDSIVLQTAQKENLITLDVSIFNSQDKNYRKRIAAVEEVKNKVANRKPLKGSLVSLWFYNMSAAPIGYERGKQIARDKISSLHAQVKTKKITMKQAADLIKKDASLAQVDPSYQSNALLEFSVGPKDKIVADADFEKIIRSLPEGGLTDVYLAKDKQGVGTNGKFIDAAYMFAQVTESNKSNEITDINEWITQNRKQYEIISY